MREASNGIFKMKKLLRSLMRTRVVRVAGLFLCLNLFLAENATAQGLPVYLGSPIPVAIWLAGTVVLGLVIMYGILRTRSRTSAEKRMTDQATKDLYAREDRDARR
jgi:hypothetical protein